jgi:hypothetical protein
MRQVALALVLLLALMPTPAHAEPPLRMLERSSVARVPPPEHGSRIDGQLPTTDADCLAAEIHVESASQSPKAKAAVGQYVLFHATLVERSVCDYLFTSHIVTAMRTSPSGSWAYQVFHEDNLHHRLRGSESLAIARQVLRRELPDIGARFDHFSRCDVEATWTRIYTRYRFEPQDTECFWGSEGLDAPVDSSDQ